MSWYSQVELFSTSFSRQVVIDRYRHGRRSKLLVLLARVEGACILLYLPHLGKEKIGQELLVSVVKVDEKLAGNLSFGGGMQSLRGAPICVP